MIARIGKSGPLRLDAFMDWALTDPDQGYYATRNAFGRDGDFITAPDISQIFGELIGLWVVDRWQALGGPESWQLIELGPGRLTLIKDVLRTIAGRCPDPQVTLVDVRRHEGFLTVPDIDELTFDRPFVLVANEFFDALPIRQLLERDGAVVERYVGAAGDQLVWHFEPAPGHQIGEVSSESLQIAERLADAVQAQSGVCLAIDYGGEGRFASFQAVKQHRAVDPLDDPGTADLTAHVDFDALIAAGVRAGCAVYRPSTQGAFLSALGGSVRLAQLQQSNPSRAVELAAGYERLSAPQQMGNLFKAICFQSPGLNPPPGFQETKHGL